VQLLARRAAQRTVPAPVALAERIGVVEVPTPSLSDYNQLLPDPKEAS